jgi:hypothetical protein
MGKNYIYKYTHEEKIINVLYDWYATDVLSDIRGVVIFNGMNKHRVPFYSVYSL